jgi:quercetin dioxygenase-like cupin family protein
MTALSQGIRPLVTPLDEDAAVWFLGQRSWLRAAAAQTGGSMGLVEQIVDAGFESPYHIHRAEDELFYLLEGDVSFISGDHRGRVGAGGMAFLPRDLPHGFRVEGSAAARLLIFTTPAGFEGFVGELSEPQPPTAPPDLERLMRVATAHHIDILGPLPG